MLYFPFPKKGNVPFAATNPLVTVVKSKDALGIYYGNKRLTDLQEIADGFPGVLEMQGAVAHSLLAVMCFGIPTVSSGSAITTAGSILG